MSTFDKKTTAKPSCEEYHPTEYEVAEAMLRQFFKQLAEVEKAIEAGELTREQSLEKFPGLLVSARNLSELVEAGEVNTAAFQDFLTEGAVR